MEEQMISEETEKLAKEKGFEYTQRIITTSPYPLKSNGSFTDEKGISQSILCKWLRDVHNIHLEINVNMLREWYFTGYDLSEKRCCEIPELYKLGENLATHSYDEALEQALKEALNLIK